MFKKGIKKKVIIKNGDHSLSNQIHLKRIVKELEIIIKDVKRITTDKNIITIKVLKVDSNINSSSNY